jgi:hypothetical protein
MKLVLVPAILAIVLAACSKSESPVEPGAAKPENSAKADAVAPTDTKRLPMPEERPLSSYTQTDSGKQLGYQYASRQETVDYTALAEGTLWNDFRRLKDQFARQDKIDKAKPEMEAAVSAEVASPYHWMSIGKSENVFGNYDFERKGFPIKEFTQIDSRSFTDTPKYRIRWANASQAAFAPVVDETAAREIEAFLSGNKPYVLGVPTNPMLKVFYFVQGATPAKGPYSPATVDGWITHVQITDPATDKVLAEYSPDASIAPAAFIPPPESMY